MSVDGDCKTLSKKRMAVGALIFNASGDLLIVKPSYKDHWLVPGGIVEENESVHAACMREIKEETGLDISSLTFLCVDYMTPAEGKGESLQFIFYGGCLEERQVRQIRIDEKEIIQFRFLPVDEALLHLSQTAGKRVLKGLEALKGKTAFYLENGCIV